MRTLLLLAAAGLLLSGCGGGGKGASPVGSSTASTPSAATPSPSSPAVLDSFAQSACSRLAKSVQRGQGTDQWAEFDSGLEEYQAVLDARQSSTPGMKELVQEYGDPATDPEVLKSLLRSWCQSNAGAQSAGPP